ncbi:hypothetical protein YC2023_076351 [Brassica napus]
MHYLVRFNMNALGPRTLYYILEIAFGDLHSSLSHTYHIMNSIPLELFHEIFSRLPTKSIGRFRCMSEETSPLLLPYEDVEDLEDEESTAHVICNPSTGQSLLLPKVRTSSYNNSLGFDPIGKGIQGSVIQSYLFLLFQCS